MEAFAIRAASGNGGDIWPSHYTEAQREHYRKFVQDLLCDIKTEALDEYLRRPAFAYDFVRRLGMSKDVKVLVTAAVVRMCGGKLEEFLDISASEPSGKHRRFTEILYRHSPETTNGQS